MDINFHIRLMFISIDLKNRAIESNGCRVHLRVFQIIYYVCVIFIIVTISLNSTWFMNSKSIPVPEIWKFGKIQEIINNKIIQE